MAAKRQAPHGSPGSTGGTASSRAQQVPRRWHNLCQYRALLPKAHRQKAMKAARSGCYVAFRPYRPMVQWLRAPFAASPRRRPHPSLGRRRCDGAKGAPLVAPEPRLRLHRSSFFSNSLANNGLRVTPKAVRFWAKNPISLHYPCRGRGTLFITTNDSSWNETCLSPQKGTRSTAQHIDSDLTSLVIAHCFALY